MKQKFILLLLFLASMAVNAQVVLLQENFQDWTAQDTAISYSLTKKLFDGKTNGTFTSNALVVAPNQSIGKSGKAEGNGNPSNGRIVMKGAKTYLQLPELESVGQVNIKTSAGTDLKEFKLQVLKGGVFEDIRESITPCSKMTIKLFTFNFKFDSPTTLRIVPASGSSINIWDVQVYSFASNKP